MIHYTCDMCGKSLNPESEERFRVLIDVEQMRPGEDDSDLEHELPDVIPFDELEPIPEDQEGLFQNLKFDLCSECVQVYLQDPLAKRPNPRPKHLRFLDN